MNIAVIGTGYVGLVSGVCFSEIGNQVICVDNNEAKVEMLNKGNVPIYEPGLKELMASNMQAGNLSFTSNIAEAISQSDIIFIAVGTPSLPSGEANLSYVEQVAIEIGSHIESYKIIVTKSTVPVGTNDRVRELISSISSQPFDVASVPEFLREGSAVKDTLNPDRIVIGTDSDRAIKTLKKLHRPLTENLIITDIRSAEMIKYASNAFLATKISFINEISNICEKVGADVTRVAEGMGFDKRIGSAFLRAGIGYGGSCFPKDTQALIQIAGMVDYDFKILKSVVKVNQEQRFHVIHKLEEALGSLKGKTIAVWGLAFKPDTDDVRDAPAIDIIQQLSEAGAMIKAYDPIATDNFCKEVNAVSVTWEENPLEAAKGADALCVLTEWKEFVHIDLAELADLMNDPVMIDGRNLYSPEQIRASRLQYYSVGRPGLTSAKGKTAAII
ncbi:MULTISPECIES: UDP-glucose dehydrogenase family protein [Paenibacillus]|uniref:UDP-glucose dehydrogenase family protein n=1 Tax=Paenibacillus TaxID=44249 RepID=UPI0004200C72|nr:MULTISPECIES: UDP-glucose/GDP-mannose dehydrogenase family protein [Paenibacillus]KGP79302.1 UDP-glucose 6-dehydrogenase [Paenibacillus sp. MAEPY2]KGP86905.1 UDP-glucose 6-dehydrogenase [Paenibacillus sp. MAEPY1]OZQ67945.1 UDP-glucose 6-dehydrogenase [Paenibacillus taichungensis]HBU80599.1 UDP-glucose/GDP-mannose dehydrogenase family protein [Paenibacillus sp.]